MAITGAGRASAARFKTGRNGNPSSRPKGARATLIEDFVKALLGDFARHGKAAIKAARERSPVQYLRLIAVLVPRNWFGEEPEPEPVPAIVYEPKHERVRSPHAFR